MDDPGLSVDLLFEISDRICLARIHEICGFRILLTAGYGRSQHKSCDNQSFHPSVIISYVIICYISGGTVAHHLKFIL